MARFLFRLIEDVLPPSFAPIYLPAATRAIYVVEGSVTIEFEDGATHQDPDSAWIGSEPVAGVAGPKGATLWRWELVSAATTSDGLLISSPGARSTLKLAAPIDLDPDQRWLIRCDRVNFPPGGVALTHVHQGPGIRCCLNGEIAIEAGSDRSVHGPGEAWLELGHEPVLAPTTDREPTSFVRCFVLPRACKGRSSIRYVLAEDAAKPKSQTYRIYGERYFELP
jgi:hypothetical protein